MSLFSEVLQGQKEQQEASAFPARTALELQRAKLDLQQAAQSHDMAMRKFNQDQQVQNIAIQQALEDRAKNAALEKSKQAGMSDYVNYLKNPETQTVEGPRVNPAQMGPMPPTQQSVPMTFEAVSKSLLKRNPNMSPQEFTAAMEMFQPHFDREDKFKLAQFRQMSGGGIVGQIQALSNKLGIPFEEAQNRFEDIKRGTGIAGSTLTPQGDIKMREGATNAIEQSAQAKETGTKTGELQVKREEQQPKALATLRSLSDSTSNLGSFFKQARDLAGKNTLGPYAYASGVKGTDSYDMGQVLETIKSKMGLDKLQQMRDQSPTGSALGRVTNFEMQQLQKVLASLDQGQSKDQFMSHLDIAEKAIEQSQQRVQEAYDETYGGNKKAPALDKADPRVKAALDAGYSEEEISGYLNKGK